METILMIHSFVRWLIVLVTAVAILKFAWGWLGKQKFQAMDKGLMSAFTGLLDLQGLLGVIALFGGVNQIRMEHAFMMVIAIAIAHIAPRRWKGSVDSAVIFRNNLATIGVILVLIVVGVASVGGWSG